MRTCAVFILLVFLVGCKPAPVIKFLSGRTTVYEEGFTSGYSQLYNDGDLRNLPNTCVDGLQESFQGRNFERTRYSEVVLFARDPASIENELAHLPDASLLTDAWDRAAPAPQMIPNPLSLPVALSAEGQNPDPAAVMASPTAASFWGPAPSTLPSLAYRSCATFPGNQPALGATVNTYVVYHHGMCDFAQDMTSIVKAVVDGLWDKFNSSGDVSDKQSHYRNAISVIELGSMTDGKNGTSTPLSDVRGGFLLAFHFRGNHAGSNNEVWGTYKYLFSLDDNGMVQIAKPDVTRYSLDSSGPFGWKFKDSLRTALEKTLPETLQQNFAGSQEQTLPVGCTVIADCATASNLLAIAIQPTALALAGVTSITTNEISRMRCAIGSAADCQSLGRAAPNFSKLWDCTPPAKGMQPLPCKFRLPAKRLLMLPDALEVVWFDDFEFDNPSFVIAVLASPAQSQLLCSARMPTTGPSGYFVRQFAQAGQFH